MNMKTYACHSKVRATPMTRQDYNDQRGWTVPADENPADAGYVVNSLDSPGHVTWAPRAVFESAYTQESEQSGRPPHEQRVIDERDELATRLGKLHSFNQNGAGLFPKLHELEQGRMTRQARIMAQLLEVLDERIKAFADYEVF